MVRGRPWDVVAFHSSAAQVGTDLAALRRLVADPTARACIDRFWAAALLTELPAGSRVSLSVSQPPLPVLPGNPPVWVILLCCAMGYWTILGIGWLVAHHLTIYCAILGCIFGI